MKAGSLRRAAPAVSLVVVSLVAAACGGGGGGGGGGPTAPPPPQPAIVFTPDSAPGAGSLSLSTGAGSNATSLFLEVRVTGVQDLYGVAFDLSFPDAQLQFAGATPGAALAQGAAQASVSAPGNLVVGLSRLGQVGGFSGNGVLAILRFDAKAAGQGRFAYTRNQAFHPTGQPLTPVTWVGGGVQVVR